MVTLALVSTGLHPIVLPFDLIYITRDFMGTVGPTHNKRSRSTSNHVSRKVKTMEEKNEVTLKSRREMLKKVGKTAAFVVPTLITFKVSALTVIPSHPSNSNFVDPYRTGPGDVVGPV
jgi:hypothetical protein